GVGGEHGLSAPTAVKWAGFAALLAKGTSALPPGSLQAFAVATVLGAVLTMAEARYGQAVPSATAIGLGMLLRGQAILMIVIGGVVGALWQKWRRRSAEDMLVPLGSGFIAGEAILAVVIPILLVLNLLPE